MISAKIIKNGKVIEHLILPAEEMYSVLAYHENAKTFGQPKQIVQQQIELEPAVIEKQMILVKEAELDEQGVEISPAEYEERDVVIKEAVTEMQEVELAGEYEVEITDISAKLEQEKVNAEAQKFLDSSDWKVLRHRDQQELGLATSLSSEEFQELLRQRQMAREAIVK